MNAETRRNAIAAHKRLQEGFERIQLEHRGMSPETLQYRCNALLRDNGWVNVRAFGFRAAFNATGVMFIDTWSLRILPLGKAYRDRWIQAWTVRGTSEMRAERAALLEALQ